MSCRHVPVLYISSALPKGKEQNHNTECIIYTTRFHKKSQNNIQQNRKKIAFNTQK